MTCSLLKRSHFGSATDFPRRIGDILSSTAEAYDDVMAACSESFAETGSYITRADNSDFHGVTDSFRAPSAL
jgi:hypothetical protein